MAFTFPNTDDGTIHIGTSLHYFPGGIQSGGAQPSNSALQNAQRLAGYADVIVGNVQENALTLAITTDKYNGLADNMLSVNPSLVCMPYTKGDEISASDAYTGNNSSNVFPNDYYAHLTPWPTGAKIVNAFGSYIAQPNDVPSPSSYTDPRGWTVNNFAAQRARDGWAIVARYNTLNPPPGALLGTLTGLYHDSVAGGTFNGTPNPQMKPDGSGAYTKSTWQTEMWNRLPVAARVTYNPQPGNWPVFANCFTNGKDLQNATSGQNTINAVNGSPGTYDGGVAERWVRDNFASLSTFYSETDWQHTVDGVIAVQALGKYFWGVVNICNATAGNGTCPSYTAAQLTQWRRYTLCLHLLSNRGKAFMEFVSSTAVKPYDEPLNDSYYAINLGAPTESPSAVGMKHAGSVGSIYWRSYTLGRVFFNPTGSSVSWVADQDYYDVAANGSRAGTLIVANAATLTLQPNTAVIGYFAPPVPPGPPSVSLVTPAAGSTVSTASQNLIINATSTAGISNVTAQVGAGPIINGTQSAPGTWQVPVTLAAGANVITIKATDSALAPQTTTITPTVTFTATPIPLVCTIVTSSAVSASVLAQVLVTGGTGANPGDPTVTLRLNGGAPLAMTYNATDGYYERVITLVAGVNTLQATAVFNAQTTPSAIVNLSYNAQNTGTQGGWRGPWISQGEDEDT